MRAALSPFHQGPCWPIWLPGGSGNPPGIPVKSRFHPERFRCPNIGFQYIDLYVSTISRLLVMSVITSGTPNYLRYIKMYKLIITVIVTLSVRTLRFENNVDMIETRLRSITNSGPGCPYWLLHILRRSLSLRPRNNIHCSLCHRYVTCPRFDRQYPILSSISLPASLFTRSVIHHLATNSLVAMLARL